MKKSLFLLGIIVIAALLNSAVSANRDRQIPTTSRLLRLAEPHTGEPNLVARSVSSSFNADSTRFVVSLQGVLTLYSFDAVEMTAHRERSILDGKIDPDHCVWSASSSETLFTVTATSAAQIHAYDVTSGRLTLLKGFSGALSDGEVKGLSKSWVDDRRFAFAWRARQSAAWQYVVVWDRELDTTHLLDLRDTISGAAGFREARLDKWGDRVILHGDVDHVWDYTNNGEDDHNRGVESRSVAEPETFTFGPLTPGIPPVSSTAKYVYVGTSPAVEPDHDWERAAETAVFSKRLPSWVKAVAYVEWEGRDLQREGTQNPGQGRWHYDDATQTLYLRLPDDSGQIGSRLNIGTVIGTVGGELNAVIRIPRDTGGVAELLDEAESVWRPLPSFRGNVSRDGRFAIFSSGDGVYLVELTTEASALEGITWVNPVNCTPSDDSLEKTSGENQVDDASANSEQIITGDGYVEFTAAENDLDRACGLNDVSQPNAHVEEIDYAIRLNPFGKAMIFENGERRAKVKYKPGHVFRIAVEQGVVNYYKNDVLVYTSSVAPTLPLQVSASLIDATSKISQAVIQGAAPKVQVIVIPASVSLLVGQKMVFGALVIGTSDQRVVWTATGGQVTSDGLYTTPGEGGSYHVTATSLVNPLARASATVLVAGAADVSPPVISGIAGSNITRNSASITWVTNEASDSQVEYGTSTAYGSSALDSDLVTNHQISLNDLDPNTIYHYRVMSQDPAGNLAVSGDFTFRTAVAPDTTSPSILSVSTVGITPNSATATWITNEPSDTQVEWGPTTVYGNITPLNTSLVTTHSVALTGLASGTTYHYRVRSRDAAGNLATSGNVSFTTAAGADTAPPAISAVTASAITTNSATIIWTTSEPGDSEVDWGLTAAYGNTTRGNTGLVTIHGVTLTGLAGGTTYHYRVKSRDAAGNLGLSGDFSFTTTGGVDTSPPVISGVGTSAVTSSSVTIVWATNEPSDTQVDWGPTSAYGNTTPLNTAKVTSHTVTIIGLAAGTTYHYRVKSRDTAGNLAMSGNLSFTTSGGVDTTPPVISGVGTSSVTPTSATIIWTTNEASDTQVDWGPTSAYGNTTPLNSTRVTSHNVTLNGLAASTTYHYRVRSRDAAGNLALSGNFTLTTASTAGPAGSFYVSTTGSDSNPGTQAQPFRTIARGIRALGSGDTLIIRGGTYAEAINNTVPSGTGWNDLTTVKAMPGETVNVRPSGGQRPLDVSLSSQHYISFEGLVLDGTNSGANSTAKITSGAHHIRIRNCEIKNSPLANGLLITDEDSTHNEIINCSIHDNGGSWVGPDGPPHGIYISTDNNLVDGCNIYNNRNGYGIHFFGGTESNNIVRNNTIRDNLDGILVDGDSNLIYNNVFHGHGIDVQIASGSHQITGNKVYNNTFYNSGLAIAVGHENPGTNASGTIVRNNLCYAAADQLNQVVIHPDAAGTIMENNLTRNPIRNTGTGTVLSANLIGIPLFLNIGGFDFHLQLGSPARNAGKAVPEVTTDKDGVPRPQGGAYDIGAYER